MEKGVHGGVHGSEWESRYEYAPNALHEIFKVAMKMLFLKVISLGAGEMA